MYFHGKVILFTHDDQVFLTRFEQKACHSCERKNPFLADAVFRKLWIPAFAGMTEKNLNIEFTGKIKDETNNIYNFVGGRTDGNL
ncbi:Uncharacterized protein dnm_054630 [Desulfonema magnum]|uniref:Uncharacterized protein n=1 Tax=Desulfonema magnum TaxID=45655 RepID=A0A975BQV8_9BACT|nr:Uncharacterized protein dnm_054630 [Desulfonema magnum]